MFDKDLLLKEFPNEEDRILFSSVLDSARGALRDHEKRFSQFLDGERWVKFKRRLEYIPGLNVVGFGGCEECERRVLGFSPDYMEIIDLDFPIAALKIIRDLRFGGNVGHRDYLGSILSLGVNRKKIGDIFVLPEYTVAFVYRDIGEYIAANLERVGGVRVHAETVEPQEVSVIRDKPVFRGATIASLRIDAVIASAFGISRSKAQALVEGDLARVNWHSISSPAHQIKEGDLISLKGYGRAVVSEIKGKTKKDRISVILGRYM